MLRALWATPLSWIYGLIIGVRHKFFDLNIFRSEEFDIPIVCVGNLTVGGTGKTPVTEYLVRHFTSRYNVAVLSRGYRRRTRGFVLSTLRSSFRDVGDEVKQIKLKFPEIPVAVCEKRVEGVKRLREAHPEVNLIILDDAFQHRRIEAWVNILLMDYNNPIYEDSLLPLGTLRDSCNQLSRTNFVLVTKCPETINPLDIRMVKKRLDLLPYQSLYFSRMVQGYPEPLFPEQNERALQPSEPIIVMSGIANPKSFIKALSQHYEIVGKLLFRDHYTYRVRDMERLKQMLAEAPANTAIVITEKDAVKLTNRKKIPLEIQRRIYYVSVHVEFIGGREGGFLHQLEQYVTTNQKYNILHPR